MLQVQIDRHGQYAFKDGSRVLNGEVTLNVEYDYIKLQNSFNYNSVDYTDDNVSQFEGTIITGTGNAGNQVKALVLKAVAATSSDPATLYIKYQSAGDDSSDPTNDADRDIEKFAHNEVFLSNASPAKYGKITNIAATETTLADGTASVGTGSAASTITTSGTQDLVLDTNSGTNSGNITITDGANGAITATPNGTGEVVVGGNTNPGTLVLNCESNSHGIKLQSPPHSSSQSYTLKFPTGNVTADRFLKVASITGSGTTAVGQLSFAEVSGGTSWQAVKTSTFTAVAGEGYFINTTGGAIEMDLPAGNIGDEVSFIDYAGTFDTNALTIDQNGSEKIAGSTDPLTVSTERAANTLVYVDGTQGWLLKNN